MTTLVTRRTPLVWLLVLFLGLPVAFSARRFATLPTASNWGPMISGGLSDISACLPPGSVFRFRVRASIRRPRIHPDM